mgnify:CR=1 FL=1
MLIGLRDHGCGWCADALPFDAVRRDEEEVFCIAKMGDLPNLGSGLVVDTDLRADIAFVVVSDGVDIAIVDFDVHHGNGTQDIFMDDENVLLCSLFQYPFYPNTAIKNNATLVNSPLPIASDGADLKALYEQQWLPKLTEFKPELLFISAGFDAHLEDDMASLKFVESDYIWLTEQLAQFSQQHHCLGIISYLEGGYSLSALGRSAIAHVKALVDFGE